MAGVAASLAAASIGAARPAGPGRHAANTAHTATTAGGRTDYRERLAGGRDSSSISGKISAVTSSAIDSRFIWCSSLLV
jgi:hypothetical protein